MNRAVGKVYLVGAGPGDPRLLTLRGAELLADADVVLYDGLVNPLLLQHTSGRVERTARTRDSGQPVVPQQEINRRLIDEANAGNTVVRLKGGDPFIFGRGSEEALALTAAGIPFEIVPGITAATAAGVYSGFSYTHREHASAVAFVTGHETPERDSSHLDYEILARFPGTLVFYMGLARLPIICEQLLKFGMMPATPAAVVSHASLPEQQVVSATLSDLAEQVDVHDMRAPSLIVIGECVSQRTASSWFERLPLFGQRIGITRPQHQAQEVVDATLRLGGNPVVLPLIEILPPTAAQQTQFQGVLERLPEFQWLVLTSANAVDGLMETLWQSGTDIRQLGHLHIGAVGTATAAALESWSLRPDVIPTQANAESLASELGPRVEGTQVLWPAADRARPALENELRKLGAVVTRVVAYRHSDSVDATQLTEKFNTSSLDWIGLSSPAIATLAATVFPALLDVKCSTRIASISPLTTAAAEKAGLKVHAEAANAGWNGILEAIAATNPPAH